MRTCFVTILLSLVPACTAGCGGWSETVSPSAGDAGWPFLGTDAAGAPPTEPGDAQVPSVPDAPPNYPVPPPGPPPIPPSSPITALTTPYTYAINNLFFGDSAPGDTSFAPDPNGWTTIGYDLDNIDTQDAGATNVCHAKGGTSAVRDGVNGVDNSFGENITPLIAGGLGLTSDVVSRRTIQQGDGATLLLTITGIMPGSGNAQTAAGLSLGIVRGAPYQQYAGGPPAFSEWDEWPVDSTSVVFGLDAVPPFTPTTVLPTGGITAGLFTSGAPGTFVLPVPVFGVTTVPLTIHHAIITFQLEPDGSAGGGIIAGVLDPAEFEVAVTSVAASLQNTLLCKSLPSLVRAAEQATDIMMDGTNAGGKTCDGISIGVGFTARPVGEPVQSVWVTPSPAGSPCP